MSLNDFFFLQKGASYNALIKKMGKYHQKKLGIHHDLNAELMKPLTCAIDNAFHAVIDNAPNAFKALATQTIKSGFHELNKILRGISSTLSSTLFLDRRSTLTPCR